jgi:hypothetical protein
MSDLYDSDILVWSDHQAAVQLKAIVMRACKSRDYRPPTPALFTRMSRSTVRCAAVRPPSRCDGSRSSCTCSVDRCSGLSPPLHRSWWEAHQSSDLRSFLAM